MLPLKRNILVRDIPFRRFAQSLFALGNGCITEVYEAGRKKKYPDCLFDGEIFQVIMRGLR